ASVSRYSLLEWTPEEIQQTNGFPNTVEVLYPMDGIYTVHGVKLMVRTDYPMPGKITFRILENPGNKPLTLAFPGMQHIQEPGQCLISFCSGEVVRDVKVDLHLEDTAGNNNGTGKILYAGYQILGCAEENRKTGIPDVNSLEQSGKNWTAPDGTVYIPISERYLDTPEGIQHKKIQIIWQ
ncbi:MAG: hypothetical protein IJB52_04885, partial [Clostridia bacterium]|nr:hypothetical protein [Clostridia bacterium]